MTRPFLLAQLSDPHIGADWGDGDPLAGLEAVAAAAAERRPDAVVVTGDLADHAGEDEYAAARELLERIGAPLHVLPGNHDDRATLRRCLGVPGAGDEPVRYAVGLGPLRLVVLDSTCPGHDHGELDGEQLEWLDATLAAEPDAPALIAMHHPPVVTGVPAFDAVGVVEEDRRALGDVLARHPQVRRVIAGHVHRVVTGAVGGRAVLTAPSTYVQLALELADAPMRVVPEPRGFVLHAVAGGQVASHVQPVID